MATYKHKNILNQSDSDAFDNLHKPGTTAPLSGIYRCHGCGREVASNQDQPLPPQNHHQHKPAQGEIRWRLAVFADHTEKS
ncbi:MAG TPA: hypothetical protein VHA70_05475 [Bauldia sp.]|nr:hypothetical protein [Bauldia sp.]